MEWSSAERRVEEGRKEGRKEGVCRSRFLLYEFVAALSLQQAYAYSSAVSTNMEPTGHYETVFSESTRIFWEREKENQADAKETTAELRMMMQTGFNFWSIYRSNISAPCPFKPSIFTLRAINRSMFGLQGRKDSESVQGNDHSKNSK